jgi:enterochelin esterase-like enzyme
VVVASTPQHPAPVSALVERQRLPADVRLLRIEYRAWDGNRRPAYVLLPRWYGPRRDPAIPLIISPHGRGVPARYNVNFWGDLPAHGPFAVVNPDGQGRRLGLYSWGDAGQIDDLARMPQILRRKLPWLRIDPHRVYAFGGSMGGQETLLLVARYPHLLAGAASFDADTDLAMRYRDFPELRFGGFLQWAAREEVGGTPTRNPTAYERRSPLDDARAIARSGVPLQLWWSTRDKVVVDQARQTGLLYQLIERDGPRAPVTQFVGTWAHTAEMRWNRRLPSALQLFGLLPGSPKVPTVPSTPVSLPGFTTVESSAGGGTLLRGAFPDPRAPQPLRPGYVYLPPGFSTARSYPVVYLLHGMPGGPEEYVDSLHIDELADTMISSGGATPFIAVVPAAGAELRYNGEWAGPWEDYLVHGVVPWVDAHLPTIRTAAGRTLAGLSAGGYGAVDIGLRSPLLFGRIEAWSGYFKVLHDGPFKHADPATVAANDPARLVTKSAPLLRALGTRFFLGSGPSHSHWFSEQETLDYAAELRRLRLPVTLQLFPTKKGEWYDQLQACLAWAFGPQAPVVPPSHPRDRPGGVAARSSVTPAS